MKQRFLNPLLCRIWQWVTIVGLIAAAVIIAFYLCRKDRPVESEALSVSGMIDGYAYVDMGLPSGLKWAICNIGASSLEEYGSYFAWGETSTKSTYNWTNYKFWKSGDSNDNVTFNKYNTKSDRGIVDNKTHLDLSDDAARTNWGGRWRMPTVGEWDELVRNCTWLWTTRGGINGYLVTSKVNGNDIFFPAAGWLGNSLYELGSGGLYWSSSLNTTNPHGAWCVYFTPDAVYRYNVNRYGYRQNGFSVRPVTE